MCSARMVSISTNTWIRIRGLVHFQLGLPRAQIKDGPQFGVVGSARRTYDFQIGAFLEAVAVGAFEQFQRAVVLVDGNDDLPPVLFQLGHSRISACGAPS